MKKQIVIPFNQETAFKKSVTAIGSRSITSARSKRLYMATFFLALEGYRFRSGGADGSDTSCELGVVAAKEFLSKYGLNYELHEMLRVLLPWEGFNGRFAADNKENWVADDPAFWEFTKSFHQNSDKLSKDVRKLHGRNAPQVLGAGLNSPSSFVICDTSDGAYKASQTTPKTGGTGQAIRIADSFGIKVFNLNFKDHEKRIVDWENKIDLMWVRQCGVSPMAWISSRYDEYRGLPESRLLKGDIVELAKALDVDVVAHGANCQGKFGRGVAKRLVDTWPSFSVADKLFTAQPRIKLGKLSVGSEVMESGKTLHTVNIYSQLYYSNDPDVLCIDYNKTRIALAELNKRFSGSKIILPKIGVGLASGCWLTISNLIRSNLRDVDYYVCEI